MFFNFDELLEMYYLARTGNNTHLVNRIKPMITNFHNHEAWLIKETLSVFNEGLGNNKLEAIKFVKNKTDMSLLESKYFLEDKVLTTG